MVQTYPSMSPHPIAERLAQVVAPAEVRINAARPGPPPNRRVHPVAQFRVIIPLEGRKEEIYGDGVDVVHWAMRPGDALVLRPHTWICPLFHTAHRHLGIVVEDGFARCHWSRCTGGTASERPVTTEVSGELTLVEGSSARRVVDALCALSITDAEGVAVHLLAALLPLLRSIAGQTVVAEHKLGRTWRRVLGVVHDQCHRGIGREEVAEMLGMSPNYLSRLCRLQNQSTFIELINRARLERAVSMLRHVDLPVAAVGHACGFSDPGYFIRSFRRIYGVTPGAFRQGETGR